MSYDTITARGQVIRIGNETWENKLIDVRNGRGITMIVDGAATIRNIGVKGLYRGSSFIFSITNTGGTVEFDNVYIGDGANKDGESFVHGPGAIFYHRSANCRVNFKNMNVQGYPNNGFYCSNTAHGGSVHWENCYGKNNGVTTFRCASGNDSVRNCVAYNDNTDYSTSNGRYGGYGETNGRPLWVWAPGNPTVVDNHFAAGPYPAAVITHTGASVTLRGGAVSGGTQGRVTRSNVGNNPDLSVPDGVPESAEEAASGGEEDGGGRPGYGEGGYGGGLSNKRHSYSIQNNGDKPVKYWLQAEGGAGFKPGTKTEDKRIWVSDHRTRCAGVIDPGDKHIWGLDTLLQNVQIDPREDVEALVNGQQSNLNRYPLSGAHDPAWMDDVDFGEDDEPDGPDEEEPPEPPEQTPEERIEELEEEKAILEDMVQEHEEMMEALLEDLEELEEANEEKSGIIGRMLERLR